MFKNQGLTSIQKLVLYLIMLVSVNCLSWWLLLMALFISVWFIYSLCDHNEIQEQLTHPCFYFHHCLTLWFSLSLSLSLSLSPPLSDCLIFTGAVIISVILVLLHSHISPGEPFTLALVHVVWMRLMLTLFSWGSPGPQTLQSESTSSCW